jgi:hypothetical protein
MAAASWLQTSQITQHGHVPRASWHQCTNASWPDGRAAEQNRDRAGQGTWKRERERWTMTLATLCRLHRWRMVLFPRRWESVCAQTGVTIVAYRMEG